MATRQAGPATGSGISNIQKTTTLPTINGTTSQGARLNSGSWNDGSGTDNVTYKGRVAVPATGSGVSNIRPIQSTPKANDGSGTSLSGQLNRPATGSLSNSDVNGGFTDSTGSGDVVIPAPTTPTPTTPTPTTPTPTTPDPAAAFEEAYQRALAYGSDQVASRGFNADLVDQYGILDLYKEAIDRQKATLDPTAADPYSLYSRDTFFNDATTDALGRYRADLRNTLNTDYGEGFEYNQFNESSDDALLQAILDQQRNDAQLVIDRSRARGSLNDSGYTRANTAINDQAAAGLSSLQSLGGGILADYRKQLGDTRNNALTRINTADFTSPYNVNSVVTQLGDLRNKFSTEMGNDIQRAVGGQQFFDPSTAISRGGQVQGTINPSRVNPEGNPLFAAFQAEDRRKTFGNNSGSTASTGTF